MPQVGRQGTGGDTLKPQQPEEFGPCTFGPPDTSQFLQLRDLPETLGPS